MAKIKNKQIEFSSKIEFLTPLEIKNLANGTEAADAVNKSQLSAAEAASTEAVAAEAALRAAADLAINVAAAAESAARIAGDSAEAARAAAAEGVLSAAIDTEKGRVDAILSLSDADKNSFKEIVDLINSVDATNDSAFAGYVVSNNAALDAETSARSAADTAAALRATAGESISSGIRADLTAEAATARAAESAEAATRASEVARIDSRDLATEVRIYNVEGSVSAEIANRISDVADEETRALAAEALLSGRITAEVSRATGDVDTEETRALAAEGVLGASIASETANRITDVNAEETRATDAEGVLQSNISAEAASRIAADSALTSAYTAADSAITSAYSAADTAEASVRSLADITLQGNINVEKGRVDAILLASDADKDSFAEIVTLINSIDTANDSAFAGYVLSNNAALSAEVANRIADVTAEEERAIAAEAALQASILAIADTTTASNGLTKTGVDVKLGGELLQDTDITGAFQLKLGTNGSKLSGLERNVEGQITTQVTGGIEKSGVMTYHGILTNAQGFIQDNSLTRAFSVSDGRGALYTEDYSAGFEDNSLVSKKYVDDNTALATVSNKSMSASITTAPFQLIAGSINFTPLLDSYVQVFINGLKVIVGSEGSDFDVYFADPADLATPKAISAIVVGDVLVRGYSLGYDTDATDVIDYDYAV